VGIIEEDVARVRAETDFVAVAQDHMQLKRAGTQYSGLCPFHTEKSPSFSLNAALGVYYCFGCGVRGDVITFVRELDGLGFAEAVESLAVRAGITLRYDDAATGRDHQRRTLLFDALAQAVAWYHERLLRGPDSAAARRYLRTERGYDGDLVRKYQLGWAPEGWDQLLRSLKVPRATLVDAGLAQVNDQGRYADFFRGRLLVPILDQGGRPIGAGGRILPGGRGPKYKNTAATAVYDKSKVLYGLNWAKLAITAKDQIVVCEGYTDVIGLHSAGVEEAVATCGTALADGHIRALVRFARRIVLAYDADAAGQSAAEHYYGWEQRYGVDIRVAALPAGTDPADLARQDPAALQFRLERLFARSDLETPEGRVRAATSAVGLIDGHPNDLVRDQYLMEVADRCRIEASRLRSLPVPAREEQRADDDRDGRRGGRTDSGRTDGGRPDSRRPDSRPGGRQDRRPARGSPDGPGGAGVGSDDDDGTGERPTRLYPQEAVALRLAIHHPEAVADRLQRALFAHPVNRAAFDALASAATFGEAVAAADPQTGDLLGRLAVEDTDDDPDDVMVRLVEVAARRATQELERELRAAPVSDHAGYVETMTWLKHTREALRTADGTPIGFHLDSGLQAERLLVAWLVEREQAFDLEGGPHQDGTASTS
jgi:DNA primase